MKKEVQRLLEKADHALEVAESLYKQGFAQDAASKLYYAWKFIFRFYQKNLSLINNL